MCWQGSCGWWLEKTRGTTRCSVKNLQEEDTEPQQGPRCPVTPQGHGVRPCSVCGSRSQPPLQTPAHLRAMNSIQSPGASAGQKDDPQILLHHSKLQLVPGTRQARSTPLHGLWRYASPHGHSMVTGGCVSTGSCMLCGPGEVKLNASHYECGVPAWV